MRMASLFTEEHHVVEISIPGCCFASWFASAAAPTPDGCLGQQMSATFVPVILISIAIAVVTVVGDWLIKVASQQERTLANPWFL
ncbi:MAG TPA: hypothetical protein VHX44_16835, partial [Planctomycetota bacterium]|nr:hypothetical protein [Planctomycetota bacterium]